MMEIMNHLETQLRSRITCRHPIISIRGSRIDYSCIALHAKKTAVESVVAEPKIRKPRASKKALDDSVNVESLADVTLEKKKRGRKAKTIVEEQEDAQLSPSPLTYVDAVDIPEVDTASSALEQAATRRKPGRPRAGDMEQGLDLMDRDEDLVPGVNDAPESDDRITISDEVVQDLEWMEPLTDDKKPGLPLQFKASNWGEAAYLEALGSQHYWETRRAEAKAFEDAAWQIHHHQNRHAVNRYATVWRVARIMAEIENHDFRRGEKAPHHIAPWARAEVIFSKEFDEFNDYIRENIDDMTKRLPKEAEEEQLDILDDALFLLSRDDDNNALNRKVDQQTEDHILVEKYLDNILPGVTLSSLSEAYADEIFLEDEDEVGDDLLAVNDGKEGGEEGAAGEAPKKKRGRPKKVD
ncbi:hypothetical protein CEUSTIGMA_g9221.t1 [Chlamydomonas eustigma]|uniref:Uncharacterized protein n=1 Tax=Chlamydomonas eustigma TaxID=1157962 RepID=A0A250XFG4_9CHLO|nr:hypothetical protein CEUSTIGMA_g9221.t1 [Chlamydomonas eustigma]|eukprot:GAX81793.1 hypothetical protein CEUSTIGMA_g9221.t1 [Chlamydomonas eustigma]